MTTMKTIVRGVAREMTTMTTIVPGVVVGDR